MNTHQMTITDNIAQSGQFVSLLSHVLFITPSSSIGCVCVYVTCVCVCNLAEQMMACKPFSYALRTTLKLILSIFSKKAIYCTLYIYGK